MDKKAILHWLNKISYESFFFGWLKDLVFRFHPVKIDNHGKCKIIKNIWGMDNAIYVGKGSVLNFTRIFMHGNNNYIEFGSGVKVGKNCSFYLVGNNTKIIIGKGTTFNLNCHFMSGEDNSQIIVGEDCMFSYDVTLRTSDSHPIFDKTTGERINPAKNITIGNNVWIGSNSTLLKGVIIGDGSVVGTGTTVTKDVPANSLSVGIPNKVVKHNICWRKSIKEGIS